MRTRRDTDNRTAVEVRGLAKSFDGTQAVDGISFSIESGELFGFLGSNGAGKTTTINMLTSLVRPSAGTIRIHGIDCSKHPKASQHLMGVVLFAVSLRNIRRKWIA